MTAYVAAGPNALPVSTNSRMRAATAKLTPLVEQRRKPCATVDRQPRGPFSGALAAHGCSSSKAGYLVGNGALFPRQRANPPRERWAEICYFHPTFETEKRTRSARLLWAIKPTTTSPGLP
jgi:hypothetical protein